MLIIKDPVWYLENQNTPDKIYSNIIFLLVALYYKRKNNQKLSILFLLLFFGSSLFHLRTSNKTLLIDRITMVLVFSYFFNLFYNKISFMTFSIIGILTVLYWYKTENLFYYFTFQALGLLLFLIYFPMKLRNKLLLLFIYIFFTYIQLIDKGKYHSLKHIALAILSLFIV
jgi:hypothetical protein